VFNSDYKVHKTARTANAIRRTYRSSHNPVSTTLFRR